MFIYFIFIRTLNNILRLILSFLVIPFYLLSQDIDLTYDQANNVEFSSKIKNFTKLKSYTTKFGTNIKIGDTLVLGKAKKNKENIILMIHIHLL